jgi:hypothetical protein
MTTKRKNISRERNSTELNAPFSYKEFIKDT